MKHILIRCIVSLTLVLCLLSGCVASADVTLSGPGEYPVVSEPITVTVFCQPKPGINMEENYMTDWMEEKTGIHFEWECPPNTEFTTNFNLNIASKKYKEFYYGMTLSTAQVWQLAQDGVARPLDDLIEDYMPNFKAFLAENPEYRTAITAPDGHIYAFLRTDGGLHNIACQKVFIYEPWLETLNMEMPNTPAEFEAYLQAVKDQDVNGNGDPNDEIPLIINSGNLQHVLGYLLAPYELQPSKRLNVVDGVVTPSFTSDAYREGLTWIRGLIEKGLFSENSFTLDANTVKGLATKPEAPVVGASGGWFESSFVDVNTWFDAYKLYTSVPPLQNAEGKRATINNDGAVQLNSFISTACDATKAAALAKWCDFWYSEEGAMLNYIGFEGLNWVWVDAPSLDGNERSAAFMQVVDPTVDTSAYTNWNAVGFRGQTPAIRYSLSANEEIPEYHYMTESLRYMDYLPEEYIPSLIWFTSEENEIVNLYQNDILSYVNEARSEFLTGIRDIRDDAQWQAYLAEFDYLETEAWIAAYQSAYNRMMGK